MYLYINFQIMQIMIQCNKHQQSQGQLKRLSRQCNGFTGVSKKFTVGKSLLMQRALNV